MLLCRNGKLIFKNQNKQGYSTPTLSIALYLNSMEYHITIIQLIKNFKTHPELIKFLEFKGLNSRLFGDGASLVCNKR